MKIVFTTACFAAALFVFQSAGSSAYATGAAAKACKGLAETACQADENCSWVKPGKSILGKEKKGYCRSKPAKKAK